jgi:hypothetical protein
LDLKDLKNNSVRKNLDAKKENLDHAADAIKESIRAYPGLGKVFEDFEKTLPKDNDFEVTRALIAFANFADKVKDFYDQNSGKKDQMDVYLKSKQLVINNMLTVNKPNSARFLLSDRFIASIPGDFEFKEVKAGAGMRKGATTATTPEKPKLEFKGKTPQQNESFESIISSMLAPISPELVSKNPFGTGNTVIKQSGYLAEIISCLELIGNDALLSGSDKDFLVKFILGAEPPPPESLDTKEIQANLGAVKTILNFKGSSKLGKTNLISHSGKSRKEVLKNLTEQSFVDLLGGKLSVTDAPLLMSKLEKTRDPSLIYAFAGKINSLPVETKTAYLDKLAEACTAYAKDNFNTYRNANSPHLAAIRELEKSIKKFDMSSWETAALDPGAKGKNLVPESELESAVMQESIVSVSDDFIDLFAMGTEVQGSCLSIKTGDVLDVKDLMGNVIDGKTKLITIKKEGKAEDPIMARVALKLLWDDKAKTPVILMEGIYSSYPDGSKEKRDSEKILNAASVKIAEKLNLPLVRGCTANTKESAEYSPIRSLAPNHAPSEKCDPLAASRISEEERSKKGIDKSDKRTDEEEHKGHYILYKTEKVWNPS